MIPDPQAVGEGRNEQGWGSWGQREPVRCSDGTLILGASTQRSQRHGMEPSS